MRINISREMCLPNVFLLIIINFRRKEPADIHCIILRSIVPYQMNIIPFAYKPGARRQNLHCCLYMLTHKSMSLPEYLQLHIPKLLIAL